MVDMADSTVLDTGPRALLLLVWIVSPEAHCPAESRILKHCSGSALTSGKGKRKERASLTGRGPLSCKLDTEQPIPE